MNILTIDLEEWHTYRVFKKGRPEYYEPILESLLDSVLDLLELNNIKATFFCLGVIARKNRHIIKKISGRGHEIACHSDQHLFVNKMNFNQFAEDTKRAVCSLEDIVGNKVNAYRAPAFSIDKNTPWAIDILYENGIKIDCSIFPASRSYGGIKELSINKPFLIKGENSTLKEFPLNYATFFNNNKIMFSGGGYFRILPYKMIFKLVSKANYNMFYFHLRDFDNKQVKVYNKRFFQNYVGVNGALDKLNSLAQNFEFISLNAANYKIDWEMSKKISLN
ncbi:polysaccharide deacetylase family protein [Psychroflexus montanilacus]|uniref:polysaccharide deacetylase family protein n=1 Tax=Psychroflexus montanilacus TaxID=2873598 RepID=UPI001CCFD26B|nr:polysaccharide deacetylase family protein [Psychroflexus montanilacus]MBZ9652564.1 polysaccharide deacetylase family protein [Psychroflexus montanilacus]